jgi:Shikimate kinase
MNVCRHVLQVEAHARMTVKEIFEQEGEEAFREVETAVLQVGTIASPCATSLILLYGCIQDIPGRQSAEVCHRSQVQHMPCHKSLMDRLQAGAFK